MSSFCPTCGNILHIFDDDRIFFYCRSCPYRHNITTVERFPLKIKNKKVDDILGGAEAWDNVDKTQVTCPKCSHGEAFWMEFQTRGADEPTTLFYKCANMECQHQWKEG